MAERNILITGATDGIGKATARRLAASAPIAVATHIWLIGRNPDKTAKVVAELSAAFPKVRFGSFIADLSLMSQVRRLGEQVANSLTHLDILINNAGGYYQRKQLTGEGFELTFALNHLSPFLLTNHLMPLLLAGPKARIITLSSFAHHGPALNFADLQGESGYAGWRSYHVSKLANILFTIELARRLAATRVTANACHPGWVRSNISADFPLWLRLINDTGSRFLGISAERGSDTPVFLATSPTVAAVSGRYFYRCRETKTSRQAMDLDAAMTLWDRTEDLLRPYLDSGAKAPESILKGHMPQGSRR